MKLLIAVRDIDSGTSQGREIVRFFLEECPFLEEILYVNTKIGVLRACRKDADISHLIVSQYLEYASPYTVEELNELDEIRANLVVIPLLEDGAAGDYLRGLYTCAIYNGLFEIHAEMTNICELVKHPRLKKEARIYYQLTEVVPQEEQGDVESKYRTSLQYVLHGGPRGENQELLLERLDHVKERFTFLEFKTFLTSLPDVYGDLLGERPGYEFFVEPESPPLNQKRRRIPLPIRPKEEVIEVVKTERKIIGFFNLHPKAGSSFLCSHFARLLADTGVYQPKLIQFAGTGGTFHLEPQLEGDALSKQEQLFMKEGVMVISSKDTELVDEVTMLNTFHQIGEVGLIDMGSSFPLDFTMLQKYHGVVFVLDESYVKGHSIDLDMLREVKGFAQEGEIPTYFVVNRHVSGEQIVFGMLEDTMVCGMPSIEPSTYFYKPEEPLVVDIQFLQTFQFHTGGMKLKKKGARAGASLGPRLIKETPREVKIATFSCIPGSGTTHYSLALAYVLGANYKVAYVEIRRGWMLGNVVDIKCRGGKKGEKRHGVHLYSVESEGEFYLYHQGVFDYIIYDYGVIGSKDGDREQVRERVLCMNHCMLVLPAALWYGEYVRVFVDWFFKDQAKDVVVLISLLKKEELKNYQKRYQLQRAMVIPCIDNVYVPSVEVRNLVYQLLGLEYPKKKGGVLQLLEGRRLWKQ